MDFSSYQLPGVYVNEIESLTLTSSGGGTAVPALVGESLGYRTASQQGTLPMTTLHSGIANVADITAVDKINGGTLSISVSPAAGDNSDIQATGTTTTPMQLTRRAKIYSATVTKVATPISSNIGVEVKLTDKYIVWQETKLTVTSGGSTTTLVEYKAGMNYGSNEYDYSIDYRTSTITWNFDANEKTAKSLIAKGTACSIDFYYTDLQPIFFNGVSVTELTSGYAIVEQGGTTPKIPKLYKVTASSGSTPPVLTEDATKIYNTDYILPNDMKEVSKTATSSIPDYGTTGTYPFYVQNNFSKISQSGIVQISYKYTPEDFYKPLYCENWQKVKENFGDGWNSDGTVNSEVSRAAFIAFKNGSSGMWISPVVNGGSGSDWQVAFEALDIVNNLQIIVPVTGQKSIHDSAVAYANSRTVDEKECRCILGADGVAEPISSATLISRAVSYANERVAFVSPSTITMVNPMTNIIETVAGYLIAAAVAGYSSSVPQYTPLTNKNILGFEDNAEYRTKAEVKNEISNGIMYVGTVGALAATIRIVQGVTTDTSTQPRREYNVSITKDFIYAKLRAAYSPIIGNVLTSRTLASVESITGNLLSSLLDSGYINAYDNVKVDQDDIELTKINVAFSYKPVFGVNYIEVTFTIDTESTL